MIELKNFKEAIKRLGDEVVGCDASGIKHRAVWSAASTIFLSKVLDAAKLAEAAISSITASIVCYPVALQWGGAIEQSSKSVVGTLVGFAVFSLCPPSSNGTQERKLSFYGRSDHRKRLCFLLPDSIIHFFYFEAIRRADATDSRKPTLPFILDFILIMDGVSVGRIGVINPFLIVGGVLTAISCGFLMTSL
ncbi:hypothetical protein EAF04_004060 [Stromatinia cepivora]|nr:hypothetical protein EAF04_004060 [Stromatinia cepivora]